MIDATPTNHVRHNFNPLTTTTRCRKGHELKIHFRIRFDESKAVEHGRSVPFVVLVIRRSTSLKLRNNNLVPEKLFAGWTLPPKSISRQEMAMQDKYLVRSVIPSKGR